MSGYSHERVLGIPRYRHNRAHIRRGCHRDQVRDRRELEPVSHHEDDGRENQTNRIVHEKSRQDTRSKYQQNEQLKARSRHQSHVNCDPIEETRYLEMRDQDHHAQQKQEGVPIDDLVGLIQRQDAG